MYENEYYAIKAVEKGNWVAAKKYIIKASRGDNGKRNESARFYFYKAVILNAYKKTAYARKSLKKALKI